MHLISLIQQKIELIRLENRYTRRRNRRSTFVSEAQYVDGEYIYSPTSSYSAKCSAGNSSDSDEQMESRSPTTSTSSAGSKDSVGRTGRASKRMSMMGLDKMDWRKGKGGNSEKDKERRLSTVVVSEREVKWDDSVRR